MIGIGLDLQSRAFLASTPTYAGLPILDENGDSILDENNLEITG